MGSNITQELHRFADELTMNAHIRIHLVKITHVNIANIMDLLNVLSRSIVWLLLSLANKHRANEIVDSSLDMCSELILVPNLLEWS